MQNRRRIKLILPELQLRLIGTFAAIAALALVMQHLLFTFAMSEVAAALPNDGLVLMQLTSRFTGGLLLLALALFLPATFWIGVLCTFRIAGPLYRFERYLGDVARGERPPDCKLRRGDQLQDLCRAINDATRPVREGGTGAEAGAPAPQEEREAA